MKIQHSLSYIVWNVHLSWLIFLEAMNKIKRFFSVHSVDIDILHCVIKQICNKNVWFVTYRKEESQDCRLQYNKNKAFVHTFTKHKSIYLSKCIQKSKVFNCYKIQRKPAGFHRKLTYWIHYRLNKKLICRRETARCFVSLNISLSHSMSLKSFEMTPLSRT